jgi:hypothetical protein
VDFTTDGVRVSSITCDIDPTTIAVLCCEIDVGVGGDQRSLVGNQVNITGVRIYSVNPIEKQD